MIASLEQAYKDSSGNTVIVRDDFGSSVLIQYRDPEFRLVNTIGLPTESALKMLHAGTDFVKLRHQIEGP